jgi:hypothetical protein
MDKLSAAFATRENLKGINPCDFVMIIIINISFLPRLQIVQSLY